MSACLFACLVALVFVRLCAWLVVVVWGGCVYVCVFGRALACVRA